MYGEIYWIKDILKSFQIIPSGRKFDSIQRQKGIIQKHKETFTTDNVY